MATVDRVDSKRRSKRTPGRRKEKSHAFRNGCVLMLVVLIAVVYFAPIIVAGTPLRSWLVQTALAPDGTITLGSASLGWFSPVAAEKLQIRDAAGAEVVTVESLRTDKSLIALLLDVNELGRLHVVRPSVHLVAHETDTNLERVFARLLAAEGSSSTSAELDVTEGTLAIDDAFADRKFKIEKLSADCKLSAAGEGVVLAASGTLVEGPQGANFKLDLRAKPSVNGQAVFANGKIQCQASALPLELLQPLVRRAVEGAKLSGQLSAQLDGAWGEFSKESTASLSGQVVVANLAVAANALAPDQIRLARVEIPCRVKQKGELIEIDQLAVHSDAGAVALSGSFKTSDLSADDALSALARENYQVKGHVDLARLARMLPSTLMIRRGTEITSGQMDLAASARPQPSGMSWTGLVETKKLAATANGRPFAWDNPLAVQFAVRESGKGIVIDRAVCTSSFLQVNAAGSLDDLTATADFDLARLVAELRQFSDLNNVQLAGAGRAQLKLKRQAEDRFAADADFQARGFQWITGHARPWKEDNLLARLRLQGRLNGQTLARVDEANLAIESGSDHLEARLREAVVDPANATWPVDVSWRGELAPWTPRLESCLGLTGWDLAGSATASATLSGSSKALTIDNAKADVSRLAVAGHGWFVNEPAVSATFGGKCDLAIGRVELTAAKVSAGTAVVQIEHALLRSAATGWALDGGTVRAVGELAQLARWRQDPRRPPAWQLSGSLTADAKISHENDATTGQIDVAVDRLQIIDASRPAKPAATLPAWQERRVTVTARGAYQHAGQQVQLEKLAVASDALRLDASGVVAASQNGGDVDLKGIVGYDWERLAPVWRPYLGQSFQIAGRETRDFTLRGQLGGSPIDSNSWKGVQGEAAVGWTSMNVYGLRAGQGEIAAQLSEGQLRTRPIDFEISEGRLTVTPVARFSPAPAEVILPKGPLLTNVRLSPEICAEGLRFVTPILANATVAEGRFSITLEGGRVPLVDPAAGDVGGRVAIKGQIKPGPIAQEFVGIIKELTTILQRGKLPDLRNLDGSLMSVDSSNVEFRMMNRRVYHRGLTIIVGTTPVTTQGSVGLDESLSLVAEVPLNARLLGADLSLGTLEGKSLRIPIEGTLQKPKLDRRALYDIPAQLLENAARGVLIDGVNRGLERLFPAQP
jgi:hypothetical protein